MKTLVESILSSNGAGKDFYKQQILDAAKTKFNSYICDFTAVTFKQFIEFAQEEVWLKCLKAPFRDNEMGRYTMQFKDGSLGIEIMPMNIGIYSSGCKYWRFAWVPVDELNKAFGKQYVTSYNYMDYFHKIDNNFSTQKGARLNKVVKDCVDYIKNKYDELVK